MKLVRYGPAGKEKPGGCKQHGGARPRASFEDLHAPPQSTT